MKTAVMSIVLGLMGFSVIANAGPESSISSVVSSDGKVVIAVRPYLTREDRERVACEDKYLVPVAVLIQNYGNKSVQVLSPKVVGIKEADGKLHFSPYIKHGQIENLAFALDVNALNKKLHDQYSPRSDLLPLKPYDTLLDQYVPPGSATSDLVYLDPRDKRYRQIIADNLIGLSLAIKFKVTSRYGWSVAKLNLAVPQKRSIEKSAPPNYIGGLHYVDQNQNGKGSQKFDLLQKAYTECFANSVSAHASGDSHNLGAEAVIVMALDSDGKYLGRNILYMDMNGVGKVKTDAIMEDVKKCHTPEDKKNDGVKSETPYYFYIALVGDSAVTPVFTDLIWLYSLLGKAIVSHISENDAKMCSDGKWPIVRVKIDSDGNVSNIDAVKKGPCYESVRTAILTTSPFPSSLNSILLENLRKGILININTALNLDHFYFDK